MPNNEPVYSFTTLQNRLTLRGILVAQTALRVGAGRTSEAVSNDLPLLRNASGVPFIPGASLKGAFRARVESVVRAIAPEQARDLEQTEKHQREKIMGLDNDHAIWAESTLIDLTFGAPWIASHVFFRDATIDQTAWFNQVEVRNGVAINRDTETVNGANLYSYQVVPAGVEFAFALTMENALPWQLGMVALAIKSWERGDIQIGGFRSRGLGYIQLTNCNAEFFAVNQAASKDEQIETLLGMLGVSDTPPEKNVLDTASPRFQEWRDAFKMALTNPEEILKQGLSNA